MSDSAVLIYIHGFNSSANAFKAQQLEDYIQQHNLSLEFIRPQVADSPDPAIAQLKRLISDL